MTWTETLLLALASVGGALLASGLYRWRKIERKRDRDLQAVIARVLEENNHHKG